MPRVFQEHFLRDVQYLDGLWDFAFLGDVDPDTVDPTTIRFDDFMAVPACFDTTPAYMGKRGLVVYGTHIDLAEGGRQRLVFDSVHHWCRVFVNGQMVGEHGFGFTRFAVDVIGFPAGRAELVVLFHKM